MYVSYPFYLIWMTFHNVSTMFKVFAAELSVVLFERSDLILENIVSVAELVVVGLGGS